jgi:hypothetical protein
MAAPRTTSCEVFVMEIHCTGIRPLLIVAASLQGAIMGAKGKKIKRRSWTVPSLRRLQDHSERGTPIKVISKEMERTVGALRQQAFRMGIPIGERSADH